jgi:hypothetical protein
LPGAYCFPPLAALIAGAARLMLALPERSATDLGGTYAMCDTDSMAIVATETGGLKPCPGSVLKREDVNIDEHGRQREVWCLAISVKRYVR